MKSLEAVVVCVDYSDFLAHTLPFNRNQFNHLVVVSAPHDKETQRLCEYWHVECVVTDVFYDGGAAFNKAKGINVGLAKLKKTDFVCHLDADIALPPRTREVLSHKALNTDSIYGMDRLMCRSFRDWVEYLQYPKLQHENDLFLHLDAFPIGTRVIRTKDRCYAPLGFFQMWHSQNGLNHYPETHTTAARTDMLFSLQWAPEKRQLLPDTVCIHLGTDQPGDKMGRNWKGRTTPRFGISDVEVSPPVPAAPQGQDGYNDAP